MPRLIFTARFRSDVDSILRYLEGVSGPLAANRYARRFRATIDRLDRFPQNRVPRPMLGPAACIAIVPPYILNYDYDQENDALVMLRLLHERREIARELVRGQR
jgi:plasmid stabilization system protein ParE